MAVVIIALTIPFALTVERRAEAELKSEEIAQAQQIANRLGAPAGPSLALTDYVARASDIVRSRVIVVDRGGRLLADSEDQATAGSDYATPGRPEIQRALDPLTPQAVSILRRSDDIDGQVLATAVPLFDDKGALRGAVRITESTDRFHAEVRRTVLSLVAIGAGGLVAGLVVAFVLAGSLSRPMGRLAAAARTIGGGDLSARAGAVGGGREMAELAETFDDMAGRLQASVRAEREFAANASHQLRTPLAGMRLRLEAAAADAPEEARVHIEAAEREVTRLTDIVQQLLASARDREAGGTVGDATVDVDAAVGRALGRWDAAARARGSSLAREGRAGTARGDAADLDQMLDNMIDNALAYAPGEVKLLTGGENGLVTVAVVDRGPGMAPDEVDRVTERFYRGRGATPGGSGLGLAIVRELAERWGGTVVVASGPGGTRVEVRLEAPVAS